MSMKTLINPKVGRLTYNLIHHKALSVSLYILGNFAQLPALQLAGVIMFGHASFDRALGFELQRTEKLHQ